MFGDFGFASGRRKFMCLFRRHISNRNAARDEPHQTCTGTKKTQVLNFKVHQTCTGTKKTKVLNFKVHQTCTGTKKTKKTKTFQSTWEGASIPLKCLFFLFFLSLCRFGALWSSKLLFFLSLCRFGALWSSKLLFFLSLCRFGALWSSKLVFFCPCAGLVHFEKFKTQCNCSFLLWYCFYCLQMFLTHLPLFASHAAFWRVRCVFRAKGSQFED